MFLFHSGIAFVLLLCIQELCWNTLVPEKPEELKYVLGRELYPFDVTAPGENMYRVLFMCT